MASETENAAPDMTPHVEKDVRVITVHGTFDPGAKWDDADQPLIRGLTERLRAKGREISLCNFEWTGQNSHGARRKAAEDLSAQVKSELDSAAYDEMYLIGHSHGGTVARLAMNMMEGEKRPDGIFTFGSPFVRFKPRSVQALTGTLRWLVLLLGAATVIMLLLTSLLILGGDPNEDVAERQAARDTLRDELSDTQGLGERAEVLGDRRRAAAEEQSETPIVEEEEAPTTGEAIEQIMDQPNDLDWAGATPFFVVTGIAIFVIWLLDYLIRRLRRYLLNKRDYITSTYDPEEPHNVDYVCYHAIGDEAGILLRFWGFFTWIMQTAIYTLLYGAVAMLFIGFGMLVVGIIDTFLETSLWVLVMTIPTTASVWLLEFLGWIRAGSIEANEIPVVVQNLPWYLPPTVIVALGFLLVTSLLLAPFALLLPWLLRAQYFAFGGEDFSWSLVSDINADRLPNHYSQMKIYFLPQAYANRSMQHNYYYMDQRIITDIGDKMLDFSAPRATRRINLEQAFLQLLRYLIVTAVISMVFSLAVFLASTPAL